MQLASSIPNLHTHIRDTIAKRSGIASQSLRDQWHHLVLRPLSKLEGAGRRTSYVLVVDALDECDSDNNIQVVIQLLAEARSLETVRLRVFLTSRPETPIRGGFGGFRDPQHQEFVLHNISPPVVDHDLLVFLKFHLARISRDQFLDAGWPGPEVIGTLVNRASGLFIWAATACRFVEKGLPETRLFILLKGTVFATTPEGHLDGIYITVLQNSVRPDFMEEEKDEFCRVLRDILGSIIAAASPLSVRSLSKLLAIGEQQMNRTLVDLHAILDIPADQS